MPLRLFKRKSGICGAVGGCGKAADRECKNGAVLCGNGTDSCHISVLSEVFHSGSYCIIAPIAAAIIEAMEAFLVIATHAIDSP